VTERESTDCIGFLSRPKRRSLAANDGVEVANSVETNRDEK
jgi:hypothetical protein